MVLIEKLKNQILENQIPPFLIFVYKDNTFLAKHYIKQIALRTAKPVVVVDSIEDLGATNIFSKPQDVNTLQFECDTLKNLPSSPLGYIICNKIDTSIDVDVFGSYICELPVLEKWQLKDYLYSRCEGAETTDLDYLFSLFENDPFQLEMEMSKLEIFSPGERKYFLPIFLQDNIFGNISTNTIFTLTNALCVKNISKVHEVLKQLEYIDVEPLGLVTLMINNFRNMLLIQGSPSATAEKVGMSAKQFYAISKNIGYYSTAQLVKMLKALEQIDLKLKTGEFPVEHILYYVITLILSEN